MRYSGRCQKTLLSVAGRGLIVKQLDYHIEIVIWLNWWKALELCRLARSSSQIPSFQAWARASKRINGSSGTFLKGKEFYSFLHSTLPTIILGDLLIMWGSLKKKNFHLQKVQLSIKGKEWRGQSILVHKVTRKCAVQDFTLLHDYRQLWLQTANPEKSLVL